MKKIKLKEMIDATHTSSVEVSIDHNAAQMALLSWFYPLLSNLNACYMDKLILHPIMQEAYKIAAQFDDFGLRKIEEAPTGIGKSGLIYYSIIKWIEQNLTSGCIAHLINPLNVLNDQTTQELIYILCEFIRQNKLKVSDFDIYLNRCDGDTAANNYYCTVYPDNPDLKERNLRISSFRKYDKTTCRKFVIIISCVPSVCKTANKWDKNKCLAILDEIHVLKTTNNPTKKEEEIKVNWVELWQTINNYSKYIRGITATTTTDLLSDEFNIYPSEPSKKYGNNLYVIPFSVAIQSGRCVKPIAVYESYKDKYSLTKIFNRHHKLNRELGLNNEYIKILYTADNNEEIANVIFDNDFVGKIFISTCYFGKCELMKYSDGKIEIIKSNMTTNEFASAIDNEMSDCLVLHIQQLIAGINVKGFTGCILQKIEAQHNYIDTKQTIGRCLRKKRNKMGGIVTYLIKDEDQTESSLQVNMDLIRDLMDKMYQDNWHFAKESRTRENKKTNNGLYKEPTPALPDKNDNITINTEQSAWFLELEEYVKKCKCCLDLAKEKHMLPLVHSISKEIDKTISIYISNHILPLPGQEEKTNIMYIERLKILVGDWQCIEDN